MSRPICDQCFTPQTVYFNRPHWYSPEPAYRKPFALFPYNRPKPLPLPPLKKINIPKEPLVPVQDTVSTKLKREATETMLNATRSEIDWAAVTEKSFQKASEPPKFKPKQTKTYQYRFKIKRDIPVVSCRFTEHVMMYKKPPFSIPNPRPHCRPEFKKAQGTLYKSDKSSTTMPTKTLPILRKPRIKWKYNYLFFYNGVFIFIEKSECLVFDAIGEMFYNKGTSTWNQNK